MAGNPENGLTGYSCYYKQVQSDRRGDETYPERGHHQNAEMHIVHANLPREGKQDGCDQHDVGNRFHEAAGDDENRQHQKDNQSVTIGDSENALNDILRNAERPECLCQREGKRNCGQDHTVYPRRTRKHLRQG